MFKRLKQIRHNKNLTQREFSELLGTTRDAYASYETGRVVPALSFVKLVCSKFDINEEWLLNGTEPMCTSGNDNLINKIATEYKLDDFQQKLIQKYLELTEQQKSSVKAFLNSLFEEEFASFQPSSNSDDSDEYITEVAARGSSHQQVKLSKKDIEEDLKNSTLPDYL